MDAIIDENKKSWLQRFILWREKKIKEKHFILILSFLAGIFTALAAWFLKFLVEWIKEFLTENFDSTGVNWLYLVPAQLFVLPAGVPQKKSDSAFNGISLHDVVFNGFKITVQVEAFADGQCSGNALERV